MCCSSPIVRCSRERNNFWTFGSLLSFAPNCFPLYQKAKNPMVVRKKIVLTWASNWFRFVNLWTSHWAPFSRSRQPCFFQFTWIIFSGLVFLLHDCARLYHPFTLKAVNHLKFVWKYSHGSWSSGQVSSYLVQDSKCLKLFLLKASSPGQSLTLLKVISNTCTILPN